MIKPSQPRALFLRSVLSPSFAAQGQEVDTPVYVCPLHSKCSALHCHLWSCLCVVENAVELMSPFLWAEERVVHACSGLWEISLKAGACWESSYCRLFVLSHKHTEPSLSMPEWSCSLVSLGPVTGGRLCPKITHSACNLLLSLNEICYPMQVDPVINI